MQHRVLAAAGDWDALELHWMPPADEVDGDQVRMAAEVPLGSFEDDLVEVVRRAYAQAEADPSIKGLYWEFDPDNGWTSFLSLCNEYLPVLDWYGSEIGWIDGPDCPLAGIADTAFNDPAGQVGVARVLATFGRALDRAGPRILPVAFAWHDGDPHVAPLPTGAMTVAQVPRTPSVHPQPGAWYAVRAMASDWLEHPRAVSDDTHAPTGNFFLEIHGWYDRSKPLGVAAGPVRLARGPYEDVLQHDVGRRWLASDMVVEILERSAGPADVIDTLPVDVVSEDGSEYRRYHHVAVRTGPLPVDLTLEQRKALFGDAPLGEFVFRADDLEGRHIARPIAPYFISSDLIAVVPHTTVAELLEAIPCTGMSIRRVPVLRTDQLP